MPLEIKFEKMGTLLIVSPVGRLDANTAEKFNEEVPKACQQGETRVVFDFSTTTYISSMGLRVIITAAQTLYKAGIRLVLICSYEPVLQVFTTAGFKMLFPIYASREEAQAAEKWPTEDITATSTKGN